MDVKISIDVLNHLIASHTDRVVAYQNAKKALSENDLVQLFSEFERTSNQFNDDLIFELKKINGSPTYNSRKTNFIDIIWENIKITNFIKDKEDVLNRLEYTEFKILNVYKKSLTNNTDFIPKKLSEILQQQQILLTNQHDKIKELGDNLLVKTNMSF
jgi:uncharacterized protein (TIGR02284 family)